MAYTDVDQIKAANARAGRHFFEASTMRFFRSRVLEGVYGGRYFVTSEKPPHGPRAYTIREADPEGNVRTAEGCELCQFETASRAKAAARRMAQ